MFKTQKIQFAIRKLKKMTAVVLLSFGILTSTAAPALAASTQEDQITEVQEAPNENSAPENETNSLVAAETSEKTAAEEKVKNEVTSNEFSSPSNPKTEEQQSSAPLVQKPAVPNQNSAPQTNEGQETQAQPVAPTTQPAQTSAPQPAVKAQENKQTAVLAKEKENNASAKVAANKETKKEADKQLTIKNDPDLKKFDPAFDANKLDQSHLLGVAGAFHIFGQDVILNADTNGNIAAGKLEANVDFGTRGESHNHTQGDIYYIESGTLKQNGFRHDKDYIVLGDGFDLKVENGKVYANGTELTNVKAEEIKKAHGYLDIQAELTKLGQKADDFKKQPATAGVIANFSDMNNQYIDLSGVDPAEKTIFINIPAQLLANPQPITIKGLNPDKDGAALVLNVTDATSDKHNVSTQIRVAYNNGAQLGAGESHAHPNKLLWNFGTDATEINFNSGYFMGSVLATNATITANVNVDGNIVGKKVVINGGESHRWDLNHPLEEVQIPDQPTQPTDPTVPEEPSVPVEPEKPTTPVEPTTPEEPTIPVKPTTPEEPTVPVEPEKPTTPIEPTTPAEPTKPIQVTDPLQPTIPEEPEQPSSPSEFEKTKDPEDFTPPLAEKETDASETPVGSEPATPIQEEAVRPLPEKVVKPITLVKQKKNETRNNKTTGITATMPISQKITASSSFKNEKNSTNEAITGNEEALPQAGEQKNNPFAALIALAFSAGLLALGSKKKKDN